MPAGRRDHATAGRRRRRGGPQRLPGWDRRGDEIVKTFVPEDFAGAMTLSTRSLAAPRRPVTIPTSRSAGTKVTLALSSHAAGGLTDRDLQLAARIQEPDQPAQRA